MSKKRGRTPKEKVAEKMENIDFKPQQADDNSMFNDNERENIYDQHEEFNKNNTSDEDQTQTLESFGMSEDDLSINNISEVSPSTETSEETPAEGKEEKKVEEEVKTEAAAEKADTETTAEKVEPDTVDDFKVTPDRYQEKKPEEKESTVPYGALHEEREKRKAIQKELDELKAKKEEESAEDDDYISDEQKELAEIKKELKAIKDRDATREESSSRATQEKIYADMDEKLSAKGFPGFNTIGKLHVAKVLNELLATDPAIAVELDNPTGWAKIWSKDFKSVSKVFTQQGNKDLLSQKKDLKQEASLITTVNKVEKTAEKKKEWTIEDYTAERERYLL